MTPSPDAVPAAVAPARRRALPARPLVLAVGLCGLDVALALHWLWSPAFTALQSLLLLPWLRSEVMLIASAARRRERVLTAVAVHLVSAAVAMACLASKGVVLAWPDDGSSGLVAAYRNYTIAGLVAVAAGLVVRGARMVRLLGALAEHPARLMLASFGTAALLGGFLLTLPLSLRRLDDTSFVDALFMATSAVCVTGLAVHDVARTYTPVGQGILLLLVQVGGLGIMVLSTFLVIVAGQRLRVRSTAMVAEAIDADSLASLRRAVITIVGITLAWETAGAVALYAAFLRHPDVGLGPHAGGDLSGAGSVAWAAVFHAVSAFCNAGFSLFRGNLGPLAGDLAVQGTVAALVCAGGIGFPVLAELGRRLVDVSRGVRPPRLSLHTRTALVTSGILTAVLTMVVLPLESSRALAHLSWPERVLAALFQSVSARTAGFNTVDLGLMQPATWLVLCAFMFVGASPGSTGGGIKTTTFAVLVAALRASLRGETEPRIFDRTVPAAVVQRAVGVTFLSALLVAGLAFVLLLTEDGEPLRIVFETVSAFATVGYSTGITSELSPFGRLVLVAAMLAGRIGPMTMALALARRRRVSPIQPVEERVLIG